MRPGGYTGKILRVNLTARKINVEETNWEIARQFIGGRGYAAKVLLDEVPPATDPLGSENKIILGTGPLSGVPVSGNSRAVIVTKSPETNLFLDTYAGGHFPAETKFAGYDWIIIEGKADRPCYIWIKDDKVEIRDASHLWGKLAYETETLLIAEVGEKEARAAVIGPAGEHLSNLAIVQTDYYHQFARGGVGAVWGSKNLKALVIRGSQNVRVAHPQELVNFLLEKFEKRVNSAASAIGAIADRMKYGTPLTLNFVNARGILPTRNFRYGRFEEASKIDGYSFRKKVIADTACFGCSISCSKISRIESGPFAGSVVGGPEYETNGMLGANLGIDDLDTVIHANVLCDDLGLDTIGAGNVIGWAMECYERRILSKKELGDIDLRFGNADSIFKMLHLIANREGIGDLLAQGVKRAAKEIGRGSEEYAMHVKGLEYPAYRPGPISPAFGLVYAITERGACHRRAWPVMAEKALEPFVTTDRAQLIKNLYDQRIPWHCGCMCDIPVALVGLGHQDAATLLSAVTGQDWSAHDMQDLCERVACLIRAYNVCAGATRSDDTLAPRSFLADEVEEGAGKALTREMMDTMLDEYYALRGWSKDGIPTRETLVNLGLSSLVDKLYK